MRFYFFILTSVLFLSGVVQAQDIRAFPCEDTPSYDCVARLIYDSRSNDVGDYNDFNNNFRPYLSVWCSVKDKRFLNLINDKLNEFERSGVLAQFDKQAEAGSSYFGRQSIRLAHACIMNALGKTVDAEKLEKKYKVKPFNKRERADYMLRNGDFKGALEQLAQITSEDIENYRTFTDQEGRKIKQICFDCRSLENSILVGILQKALEHKAYDIADRAIQLFPELTIDDEDVSQNAAKRIYQRYIETGVGVYGYYDCSRPDRVKNNRQSLICAWIEGEEDSGKLKELWTNYINECSGGLRQCSYLLLNAHERTIKEWY